MSTPSFEEDEHVVYHTEPGEQLYRAHGLVTRLLTHPGGLQVQIHLLQHTKQGAPHTTYEIFAHQLSHVHGSLDKPFDPGDRVKWISQSQGKRSVKAGTVLRIVQEGNAPRTVWTWGAGNLYSDYNIKRQDYVVRLGRGVPRRHESYLIEVPGPDHPSAKPRLYWPRVSQLEPCPQNHPLGIFPLP